MIPLSIQIKQALTKLILPCLFVLSCLMMLLGQAQPKIIENFRIKVTDFLAPGYSLIEKPFDVFYGVLKNLKNISRLSEENKLLQDQNIQLKRWYYVSMELANENVKLKDQLHWISDPKLSYATARVVADVSGVYNKALLVILSPGHNIHPGEVALDGFGMIGRVTEVGDRSARILLINDASSHIPVTLLNSHAQAIMTGDNSLYPKILFYPEGKRPIEGEKVVTDSKGGAFPDGIPIGYVHYQETGTPVVVPYMPLNHLKIIRIIDYGMDKIIPPDAPGHVVSSQKKQRSGPVASPQLLGHGDNDE